MLDQRLLILELAVAVVCVWVGVRRPQGARVAEAGRGEARRGERGCLQRAPPPVCALCELRGVSTGAFAPPSRAHAFARPLNTPARHHSSQTHSQQNMSSAAFRFRGIVILPVMRVLMRVPHEIKRSHRGITAGAQGPVHTPPHCPISVSASLSLILLPHLAHKRNKGRTASLTRAAWW